MTNNEVLAKVQKLLALAKSPNEHEAALASEKAHALLAGYNLTLLDLPETNEKVEEVGEASAESKAQSPWVRQLWQQTAKYYFCDYMYSTGSHRTYHTIIGTDTNSQMACQMGTYLYDTVTRLAAEAARGEPSKGRFINAFKKACSARLARRLYDMRMAAQEPSSTNPSNLPALYANTQQALDAYKAEHYKHAKTEKPRQQSHSSRAGYEAGRAAGDTIGLNQQVGGSSGLAIDHQS